MTTNLRPYDTAICVAMRARAWHGVVASDRCIAP